MRYGQVLVSASASLIATALLSSIASAQPRCIAPQVMVVVDRSSSMSAARSGVLSTGHSKWQAARDGVSRLTASFADRVDFGLAIYPAADGANTCDPGAVVADMGGHTSDTLMAAFPADDPPYAGNWTATSQTLDMLIEHGALSASDRTRHVILITDGEQCCYGAGASGCLPDQRFWPVDSVMALRDLGVSVHVVGFGEAVDALTLNRAAVAGGTALPGCRIDSEDPASPDNCYHQANDIAGLEAALGSIARDVTDEVCDGFDNDCDDVTDEGYDLDADSYTICGSDPFSPGTPPTTDRIDCDDSVFEVHPGATEVCNAIDDDCDGVIDPGCACTIGDARPCGSERGICELGSQSCVAGAWGACEGGLFPAEAEACDGLDEDCDGNVDEAAVCAIGSVCNEGACVPVGSHDGGCGCVTAGAPTNSAAGALGFAGLLGLVAVRRRRRR